MHVSVEVDVDVGFAAAVVHAVVMGPLVVLLQYDMDRNEIFLRFVICKRKNKTKFIKFYWVFKRYSHALKWY